MEMTVVPSGMLIAQSLPIEVREEALHVLKRPYNTAAKGSTLEIQYNCVSL